MLHKSSISHTDIKRQSYIVTTGISKLQIQQIAQEIHERQKIVIEPTVNQKSHPLLIGNPVKPVPILAKLALAMFVVCLLVVAGIMFWWLVLPLMGITEYATGLSTLENQLIYMAALIGGLLMMGKGFDMLCDCIF